MLFYQASPTGQLEDFIVSQAVALALRFDDVSSSGATAVQTVNHFHFFAAEAAVHDGPGSGPQGRLKHNPFIGGCHALHDCLSPTPCAASYDGITKTSVGIQR